MKAKRRRPAGWDAARDTIEDGWDGWDEVALVPGETKTWSVLLDEVAGAMVNPSEWEMGFIESLIEQRNRGSSGISADQQDSILKIYEERC